MKEMMFQSTASVPGGTRMALTFAQADARAACLIAEDPKEVAKAVEDVALAKRAVAAARAHNDAGAVLEAEKFLAEARANLQKRRVYTSTASVFFKTGEIVGIDRSGADFGRTLTEALGVAAEDRPVEEREAERAPKPPAPKSRTKK